MYKKILLLLLITSGLFATPTAEKKHKKKTKTHIPQEHLPEPYRSTLLLPFDSQGWYGNAAQMVDLFNTYPIYTVIEVGCWLGSSTRHIASMLPPEGKLYAVDHWKGSAEHQPPDGARSAILGRLYQQFLSNVIHTDLAHKIIPIKMDSLEAAQHLATLNISPDLIYIDASHDHDSVYADLKAWFPFVQGHGILCGDDWTWGSVSSAVYRFAEENHLTIEATKNFWRLIE